MASERRVRAPARWLALWLGLLTTLAAAAAEMPLAVTADDVDWEQCTVWAGGQDRGPAPQAALAAALGLAPTTGKESWTTGPVAGEVRHFRVALRRTVAIGAIAGTAGANQVAALKPEAAYPGNLTDDSQWLVLGGAGVVTAPPNLSTRALRYTFLNYALPWAPNANPSVFGQSVLLRGRYYCPLRLGGDDWRTAEVPDPKAPGKKTLEKVTEWLGYWVEPVKVVGAVIGKRLPAEATVSALPPTEKEHPTLALPAAWQPTALPATASPSVMAFPEPLACRALKVQRLPAPRGDEAAPLLPLVTLGENEAPPTLEPPAPFAFNYEMPYPGFIAIAITNAQGQHVRRLIAEVERPQGPVREGWDLKDDDGNYVPPGTYRWRALARPPLKLTYEITVYTAGHPPWQAPVTGGGAWMADHCPPCSVATVGDRMFFGAEGAEFGVPLIATDLEGHKVWQHGSQGAQRLTSDGRYAYVVNNDSVVRIDPQRNYATETIHHFAYSDDIPGHAGGWVAADYSGAATNGKVMCVSYNAPEPPWIRSAIRAHEIDVGKCFPPPIPLKVHDTELNAVERMFSAFQTMTSSQQGFFGEAVARGPLANTLLLTLRREIPVGSVVVPDGNIQVWALGEGAKLPPTFSGGAGGGTALGEDLAGGGDEEGLGGDLDMRFEPKTWTRLTPPSAGRPGIAVTEQGLRTKVLAFAGPGLKRLEYALLLDRRFGNASERAHLVTREGARTPSGGWLFRRELNNPISYGNPVVSALVWDQPELMRGFMLIRPLEWAGVAVDVWTGPADGAVTVENLTDDTLWRQVRRYRKDDNSIKFGWHTDRVILGDLGANLSVKALRVRFIEPPTPRFVEPRPAVGGFDALLTFQHLGKDPELPVCLNERVTVLDLPAEGTATAKLRGYVPLARPRALGFDAQGVLWAACAEGIGRVPDLTPTKAPAKFEPVVPRDAVKVPRALAFDRAGQLYVLDAAASQVKVFSPTDGKLLRAFGQPGYRLGPYDPTQLANPAAMAIDQQNKVWIVEKNFQPKRISRWSSAGVFEKDFLGPTHYGGGGMMDPGDHTVVNHLGMKFRIDYAARTWRLESRLCGYDSGMYSPDRAVYYGKRRYLVGDRPVVTPFGDGGPISTICEERNGVAVPLVAAGMLQGWGAFSKQPELRQALAKLDPATTGFCWSDLNRDGAVQLEEVQTLPTRQVNRAPLIGDDLSFNYTGWRMRVKTVRDDGQPVYDVRDLTAVPALGQGVMVNDRGETFVMGHQLLDPDGHVLWSYPDRYMSVQHSYLTPWGFYTRPPGVLCGGLGTVGHFTLGDEEFFCVNGNNGDYYAFTRDGLLAAAILGGPRGYGRRFFSMPDCEPGKTDLSDLRRTVENFHGNVTRAEDGKVYAIAGKNHITVMRVDGLEQCRRLAGECTVVKEDLQQAMAWATARARREQASRRPAVAKVPFLLKPPTIDGDTYADWPASPPLVIQIVRNEREDLLQLWEARLAFDHTNLYVAGRGLDPSPMANSADDPVTLFQHGDALDVQLGLDPKADASRRDPVPGDLRLLLALVKDQPTVMLYRYVVDGPGLGGKPVEFKSPVTALKIAEVLPVPQAKLQVQRKDLGGRMYWYLEAAVPWAALGRKGPEESVTLRGDVGALESDPNGLSTVARYYWANKSNVVLSDQPSEARVEPALWGTLQFVVPDVGEVMMDGTGPGESTDSLLRPED